MKKTGFVKAASFLLAFLMLIGVIFAALILEPAVKINGFKNFDKNLIESKAEKIHVYDGFGVEINAGVRQKTYVPYNKIPKHTINAFISVEDSRFFDHGGIDYYRILGAAKNNVMSKSFSEGASTITQQLVKNTHLTGEKSFRRKINEMRIATDLERHYSKNKILEMYLNAIYFGNNLYGIGAAAQGYFNKNAKDLTLNESALLAAIINNPSKYNPLTNEENADGRRKLVLRQMLRQGYITQKEYEKCGKQDVFTEGAFLDQYANFLTLETCNALQISKNQFFDGGYRVFTYFNPALQQKISSLLHSYSFTDKENAVIHALVMNNKGEIIADASSVSNNLTQNYRQPASLIKPAISYAPAFEKKLASPVTPVLDEPTDFNGYKPSNYKNKNMGWISASDALKHSQNIPAVKLTEQCGIEYSKKIAGGLGYNFDVKDNNLALALGGMSKGALLAEAANSFQAFSAGGEFIKSSHIKKITNANGEILYQNPQKKERAVSKETAYFINCILLECAANGTARRIGKGSAAKTGTVGTENGNSDAYIVAYNPDYVVTVWIGAKKGLLSNGVTGATHPAIIAKQILEMLPLSKDFEVPEGIVDIDIDKNEYYKNHEIVIASQKSPPKDKFKAKFNRNNIPKQRKRNDDYILDTLDNNDIDFKNFEIIDEKYFN